MEFALKHPDCFLRYHDLPGEKTPIVWLHGLGCAGSFDYPQVAAQAGLQQHRRLLVDLLGAGYSDKPAAFDYSVTSHAAYLKQWLEALQIDKLIVFGHSLGGAVAIELAALCPQMVSTLIVSEPNLDPSGAGSVSKHIALFQQDEFLRVGFPALLVQSAGNGNSMWGATLANWSPLAAYRFSKSAEAGGSPSWRQVFYSLPVKKGFIFGEHTLPHPDWDAMQRHGIPVAVVRQAGHSMAWENPSGLAQAIAGFL